MSKNDILDYIPEEGKKNIKKVQKKLDDLLEITQCIKCKKRKPLSEFAEHKDGYLGFSKICVSCFDEKDGPDPLITCKSCGKLKSYEKFYKIRDNKLFGDCIDCIRSSIEEKALNGHTKKCTVCGEEKSASLENFRISATGKDSLISACKICEKTSTPKLKKFIS
ncbi:MAG: hypothetical protein N3B21_16045 [Clostridia bacterium]|nr:hypothetical protein [Clostridia bacterium]